MRFSRKIIACITSAVLAAVTLCGCGGGVESPDIPPHLSIAESKHVVPIDGYESFVLPEVSDTSYRERVELLYNTVVYDGKRPVFGTDDPVKPIYDAAHEFLENYIHDDWMESSREVNTVHAIHDYLISSTDYDFELYRSYQSGADFAMSDAPAFYIDGVLMDGKAVCDGLARAFNFLCAMEGIRSMRVTGSFASSLHAWNKVRIGGEWYNVDVTADAVHYNVSGKNYKQIAHGYMLVCDDTLKSFDDGHDFVDTQLTAEADYDYYSGDFLKIGNKYYSRIVKSQAELNTIFSAVSEQKGSVGKIELKLDFTGKTQVNGADMYRNEILAAYQKVDNVGFKLTDGNSPYFRFPNGVYLFLIYK